MKIKENRDDIKPNDGLKIELMKQTILSKVVCAIGYSAFSVQNIISMIFWYAAVSWIFPFIRNIECNAPNGKYKTQAGHTTGSKYTFDYKVFSHHFLHAYCKRILRLHFLISGLKRPDQVYAHFLKMDPQFHSFGYIKEPTVLSFEVIGHEYESMGDRVRGWDMVWLSRPRLTGQIRIVEKAIVDEKVRIRACWITGPNAGSVFNVSDTYGASLRAEFERKNNKLPYLIYSPGIFVFLIEVFISVGALLAILTPYKSLLPEIKGMLGSIASIFGG